MKKFLSSHGNTWQLYIPKPLTQLMGITKTSYLVNLTVKNKTLYVKKICEDDIEKYKDLLSKKLIKRNSSFGLNITVPILEQLEVNPETDMIDYQVEDTILIIKKAD